MNRKDLQNITLVHSRNSDDASQVSLDPHLTAEDIGIKRHFEREDNANAEHLNFAAGIPPYLRGPYSTMYVRRPWTIRQYAGFSTG